jgi:CRISPR-associated protein Csx10
VKRFEVVLRTHTLVAAGRRYTRGQFLESHDYIPGSVFRGAVAGDILRHCPDRDPGKESCDVSDCPALASDGHCLFPDIFLGQNAFVFTSLYPQERDRTTRKLGPVPLSLRTCKYCPGSVEQWNEETGRRTRDRAAPRPEPHGVWDTLVSGYELDVRLEESPDADLDWKEYGVECPVCGGDASAPGEPYYLLHPSGAKNTYIELISTRMGRRTRVGISRASQTAAEGLLYSVTGIDGSQEFAGTVLVPEDAPDEAAQVLDRLRQNHSTSLQSPLLIGSGNSRGLGATSFMPETRLRESNPFGPLAQRFAGLNARLDATGQAQSFSVTLTERAILHCPVTGAPTIGLDSRSITDHLRESSGDGSLPDIEIVATHQAGRPISGWSSAWQLQKWSALATDAGSAWLCRASVGDQQVAALLDALQALEERGIGERTEEGFGRLIVCHPIHWEALNP